MIITFITILAWVMLFLTLIRIWAVISCDRSPQEKIILAAYKKQGRDIIIEVIKFPSIVLIISLVWIITSFVV